MMDRFVLTSSLTPEFSFGEFQFLEQDGVRIYDGSHRTSYENGLLTLTSHRLLWSNPAVEDKGCLSLPLDRVLLVSEENGGFMRSAKVALELGPRLEGSPAGLTSHGGDTVRFSFKEGGEKSFVRKLNEALKEKQWIVTAQQQQQQHFKPPVRQPARQNKALRSGIGGIEKSIKQRTEKTDRDISKAFQDLDKLMQMARPMVQLAKNISSKIRDKQGEVSDDETVQFKSYLLSLGISDPVTRESHGSGQAFFRELAKEMFTILEGPMKDAGGMMTLTDAFCRVNRARGLELVSPEDLLNGCKALKEANVPMKTHTFDSGLTVLQLSSHSTKAQVRKTRATLEENSSTGLSASELSVLSGVSVILAAERLLEAEKAGDACRDDSVEGLRFYHNRFLQTEE